MKSTYATAAFHNRIAVGRAKSRLDNVIPKQRLMHCLDLPVRALRVHRPPGSGPIARSFELRKGCLDRPGALEHVELARKTAELRAAIDGIVAGEVIDVPTPNHAARTNENAHAPSTAEGTLREPALRERPHLR